MCSTTAFEIDIELIPQINCIEMESIWTTVPVKEEYCKSIKEALSHAKDSATPKDIVEKACPELLAEIDAAIAEREKEFAQELEHDFNDSKYNVWQTIDEVEEDNWFDQCAIEVLGYKYVNSDNIELEDAMMDLEDYIYPDESDYEDPEEYAERIEFLKRASERDQHQLITKKAARANLKRLLAKREEVLDAMRNMINKPETSFSIDDILDDIFDKIEEM